MKDDKTLESNEKNQASAPNLKKEPLDIPPNLADHSSLDNGAVFKRIFSIPENWTEIYQQVSREPEKRGVEEFELISIEGYADSNLLGRIFLKLKDKFVMIMFVFDLSPEFMEELMKQQNKMLLDYIKSNSLTTEDLKGQNIECYVVSGDLEKGDEIEVYDYRVELE